MSVSEVSCMLVLQENWGEKLTQIPRTGQGRIQEAKTEATSYLNIKIGSHLRQTTMTETIIMWQEGSTAFAQMQWKYI